MSKPRLTESFYPEHRNMSLKEQQIAQARKDLRGKHSREYLISHFQKADINCKKMSPENKYYLAYFLVLTGIGIAALLLILNNL